MNKELRKFGFGLGLGLNILGCILFYRHKEHFILFSSVGSIAAISAVLYPKVLAPLKKLLDKLIFMIGWLTGILSLLIVFYLIFTPIGILFRFFKIDFLYQRIDKNSTSYWFKRKENIFSKDFYERMG